MALLQVTTAEGRVFEHQLEGDETVIGRSSKAGLTLPDRAMSRSHARLFSDGERWLVEDLGSRNGTFVNQRRVDGATPIGVGDEIAVGGCRLRLAEGDGGNGIETDGPIPAHTILRPVAEILQESSPDVAGVVAESKAEVQRYVARLHMLTEVHQALARSVELDELLDLILERSFEQLRPEEGAIFLRSAEGHYAQAASRTAAGRRPTGLASRSLFREVVEKGQAALVLDTATDARFHQAMSLMSSGMRSLVAAPLLAPDGALGLIVLGSRLAVRQFVEEDMELLASLASVAALRIRNLRLAAEAADRRRLEQEVALAREIQVALLPAALPAFAGWELHAGNLPSRGVSGDFYKVLVLADGAQCVLLLADVSGKGIAASLLTASLEALAAGPIEHGDPPDEVCSTVSRLLFARTPPEKYATMFLASLDVGAGELVYANAGHNPGLVVRTDGSSQWLASTGVPIGMLPAGRWTAERVRLEPGDLLILYTDGITEAENPEEEEYGPERLERVAVRERQLPLRDLALALEADLETFAQGVPFADDRTFVMLRRSPQGR